MKSGFGTLAILVGVAYLASRSGVGLKNVINKRTQELADATLLPGNNNRLSMDGVNLEAPPMGIPSGPGGKLI